jgi:hypothetical protein
MDNAELQALINDLDELSAWLWMGGEEKMDTAIKMDAIVDRHRPKDMLGD